MNVKNSPKIRLLYLTCSEIVANYGIFDTQVKNLLQVMAKSHQIPIKIHLFSLMPIVRLLKWRVEIVFFHYRKTFRQLLIELAEVEVKAHFRPLLSVYPLFYSWRPLQLVAVLPPALIMLLIYVWRNRINVIHCRSYHAGLLGLMIKKLIKVPYIFDPRSGWVAEQVVIGRWRKSSWSHRVWKKLEMAIVSNAAYCIVVSDPMKEAFASYAKRIEVIYTTASQTHFEQIYFDEMDYLPEELGSVEKFRQLHNRLLVFSTGSFNQWNNLEHLLARFESLCEISEGTGLVIMTSSSKTRVLQTIAAQQIDPAKVLVLNLPSNLVPMILNQGDYGILVMPKSIKTHEVMSVKFGEYLAAGLPVICDEYIGGAAHVIRQHQVGILLSEDWNDNKIKMDTLQENYADVSSRCKRVAKELFSVHIHAERYFQLYQEIVDETSK